MLYQRFIRPILFRSDPERVHERVLAWSSRLLFPPCVPLLRSCLSVTDPRLSVEWFGLPFENPVGIAAGFDKNSEALLLWDAIGSGAVEIGTVTPQPQLGNPKPRIFRLPEDTALINRLGFPSLGMEKVASTLESEKARTSGSLRFGVNIGKNKDTPLEDAAADYVQLVRRFQSLADYFVINVSSPNTPGLRELQSEEYLRSIISEVSRANEHGVPVLVKLSPDQSEAELLASVDVCMSSEVSGIVAVNTTVSRERLTSQISEAGGLSGDPLFEMSRAAVQSIFEHTEGKMPIIGVGGVRTGERAWQMIESGASLVQLYTGMVYEGPLVVRSINRYLLQKLEQHSLGSVSEARGRRCR